MTPTWKEAVVTLRVLASDEEEATALAYGALRPELLRDRPLPRYLSPKRPEPGQIELRELRVADAASARHGIEVIRQARQELDFLEDVLTAGISANGGSSGASS